MITPWELPMRRIAIFMTISFAVKDSAITGGRSIHCYNLASTPFPFRLTTRRAADEAVPHERPCPAIPRMKSPKEFERHG
jgi:hypothetical protein